MRALNLVHGETIAFAHHISTASDDQVIATFHRLRFAKRLSSTVRGLNHLLSNPEHKDVALQALRRLGLERCA
jgi:hypothetical protein